LLTLENIIMVKYLKISVLGQMDELYRNWVL